MSYTRFFFAKLLFRNTFFFLLRTPLALGLDAAAWQSGG